MGIFFKFKMIKRIIKRPFKPNFKIQRPKGI